MLLRRFLRPLGFLLTLVLAACITEPPPPAPKGQPAPVARDKAAPAPPRLARLQPPKPKPEPAAGLEVVGKSDIEVVELLGPPASATSSAAAKVLLYRGEDCAVAVHFFPDVKQGGFRALESRVEAGGLAAPDCLERVRSALGRS